MKAKFASLSEIQQAIARNALTLVDLVNYYLDQASSQEHLNAYVELYPEEARQRARELDQKYQKAPSSIGPLFGMVVSVKDVICYADHELSAGSKILEGFQSLFSATAIERLLAADAIIIGRTNCDEFGMGSSNETSVYGPTRNAADAERVPGGSSGGSAVSVQADTCLAAIGSDTGGSVRQPAAFCGLFGFKPTYGRISRHGLIAYASSFDQIGVITRNTQDAAALLQVMAGPDDYDATCLQDPLPEMSNRSLPAPQRIAYFAPALDHPSLDSDVRQQTLSFIARLQEAGHTVQAVDFDLLDYLVPVYYVLTTAEASSNLSRYDGVRYGHRTANAETYAEVFSRSRTEGFGREVKRRIMLGTFVLSSGYYDAYYQKAQQIRRMILERTQELFQEYDFLLIPTTPGPAWKLGEKQEDPIAMYLADIFTVQANLCGIPAISFPIGDHQKTSLPLGLQLMADRGAEEKLLRFTQQVVRQ